MATSLVTGGAGFIGSSIVEALLGKGEHVRVLDDFSSGRRENLQGLKGNLEVVEGTIVDPATVQRAAQGVDVIFHEAAIPSVARSVENPLATMKAGVIGTTNVLDAAREARVRRVVFAASSSVYGDTPVLPKVETMVPAPLSPYAVSKLVCEHMMRVYASLFGLETVSLRYFNVFGPKQDPKSEYAAAIPKFITAAIRNKRPTVFGDGEQTRDFCYIDNVVAVNLLAASTAKKLAGEVVNIACGQRISINQLIRHIGEEAKAAGSIPAGSSFEPNYEPVRPGDVRDSLADITAAKTLLGFDPKIQVREGLKTTFQAFLKFTK